MKTFIYGMILGALLMLLVIKYVIISLLLIGLITVAIIGFKLYSKTRGGKDGSSK